MQSEQLNRATQDTVHAVDRAERLGFLKDARRLRGRLVGLQYSAGILSKFDDYLDKIDEQVETYGRRVAQAERNGHPNTAMKLNGVGEGLVLAAGIVQTEI